MYESIWGPEYTEPKGYIAENGTDAFAHRFGGSSWKVADPDPVCGGPTLLLTLDLSDPRLGAISLNGLNELPLCSYINGSAWTERQVYRIIPDERRIELVKREDTNLRCPDVADMLPTVIDELPLSLRNMRANEYSTDEDNYWEAWEAFTGGDAFIRILGTPLFDQVITPKCDCGRVLDYVAAIGYENLQTGSFINGKEFFIGEGELYFFLCPDCFHLEVHSQGS